MAHHNRKILPQLIHKGIMKAWYTPCLIALTRRLPLVLTRKSNRSFQSSNTLCQIRFSTTNRPNEESKIKSILSLNCDVNSITESHTDHNKLNSLKSKYRTDLSCYEFFGHDSLNREVTVMLRKSSGCYMTNYMEIDSTDKFAFDIVCQDMTIILIIASMHQTKVTTQSTGVRCMTSSWKVTVSINWWSGTLM